MSQLVKHYPVVPIIILIMVLSCEETNGSKTNDLSPPTISSVDPTFGVEGTPVTIIGTNFSSNSTDISVEFNGVKADEILFSSIEQISAKVPAGATTGNISVTILDQTAEGPAFTIDRSFSVVPTGGIIGTQITLKASGNIFSSEAADNIVSFNGTQATVLSSTQTQLVTIVPTGATTGSVSVIVDGEEFAQRGPDFTVSLVETQTPENFKIAFFGDSHIGAEADAVLNLVKREGASMVIHPGDLNYAEVPAGFEAHINEILGAHFPYFYSVGNHDDEVWNGPNGYQGLLEARFNRLGIAWSGQMGVQGSFTYKGIFFVMSAPDEFGITSEEAGDHIRDELAKDESIWRISFWHKNQRLMQIGGKSDEAGWNVYEESRKGGALMATGHEHSYSRTHEMSNFQNQTVSSTDTVNLILDDPSTSSLDEGRSFAFVSGLGGRGIRDAESGLDQNPWWADVYHSDNGGQYGALFGEFNYKGDATLARFYFMDIDGVERDEFFVRSKEK